MGTFGRKECGASIAEARLENGFCAALFAGNIERARGLESHQGEILVVERGKSRILSLFDGDGDGAAEIRRVIASADDLTHGLVLDKNNLYASSANTVYRWTYTGNGVEAVNREEVVTRIPSGGHSTRTLLIDAGWLYISIGSDENVDQDSSRSNVRRCHISMLPLDFETECELFANGLRNEVGLAIDAYGTLWGVENGADRLDREDLGGSSASNDNPAEELNRLVLDDDGQPQFYGYPYCFTEYLLDPQYGLGRGTIWAWPGAEEDHQFNDERCRTETTPPELAMQAHSAPLGLTFYNFSQVLPGCQGTFPSSYDGHAFVGFHGSWNREEPTGYKVVRIPMNASGPLVAEPIDFLSHDGEGARWDSGFRPVDVKFDACGRLLVSSDGTRSGTEYSEGVVLRVCYGACGGENYTTIWNGGSGDNANEWYQRTTFITYVAMIGGLLLLVACLVCLFVFCRPGRQTKEKWAYSSNTTEVENGSEDVYVEEVKSGDNDDEE